MLLHIVQTFFRLIWHVAHQHMTRHASCITNGARAYPAYLFGKQNIHTSTLFTAHSMKRISSLSSCWRQKLKRFRRGNSHVTSPKHEQTQPSGASMCCLNTLFLDAWLGSRRIRFCSAPKEDEQCFLRMRIRSRLTDNKLGKSSLQLLKTCSTEGNSYSNLSRVWLDLLKFRSRLLARV